MHYDCSIIDLCNRAAIAKSNGPQLTAKLAIDTLQLAINKTGKSSGIILHSDQESQFTSQIFTTFCDSKRIKQSMSRAGTPLDNAPMEQFYNTLKHEFLYLYRFEDDQLLDDMLYDFVHIEHSYLRPHSYNNGTRLLRTQISA